ncbi:N-alpha-acetyltransferase 50 [Phytophthora nicotianae]|uniref:N-alpha-acetyltransferase 50 n=1 Tax=Phytophthora nicotianae TaxID=4792 RepID=A0A0W8DGC3_PHYNI|nr:N-alpha-acetyltransferase 50 [Phytophthora nicotianae]
MLQAVREKIAELEKGNVPTGSAAVAELTKEKDLWRMRALKMKKLKDLVQAELTTLRQQRDADAAAASDPADSESAQASADDHSKLQTRMNELQTQLANALAGAEARARGAYEKGIEAGKADAEQRSKQERDQAFQGAIRKLKLRRRVRWVCLKQNSGFSVFTDNGKNDFSIPEAPKSTDDWGEW